MSKRRPFKIEIYVAEGLPDGLRLVQKSNWIGQVIVCPRGRYTEVKKRKEFSRSGVYLLVGRDGEHVPRVYVGEGETSGIARATESKAMERYPAIHRRRRELIEERVWEKTAQGYRFTGDRFFDSPSGAASVCYGRPASGPTAWQDESGNTLKANREKATKA